MGRVTHSSVARPVICVLLQQGSGCKQLPSLAHLSADLRVRAAGWRRFPPESVRRAGASRSLRAGASREPPGWASSRAVIDTLVGCELRSHSLRPQASTSAGATSEPVKRALACRLLRRTPRPPGRTVRLLQTMPCSWPTSGSAAQSRSAYFRSRAGFRPASSWLVAGCGPEAEASWARQNRREAGRSFVDPAARSTGVRLLHRPTVSSERQASRRDFVDELVHRRSRSRPCFSHGGHCQSAGVFRPTAVHRRRRDLRRAAMKESACRRGLLPFVQGEHFVAAGRVAAS
jgi:hypothetical protein